VNQGFRYSLINQISLYAGFNPNHSVKTKYDLFFHTKNTLVPECHRNIVNSNSFISLKLPGISTNVPTISTNYSVISTNTSDFSINVSMISTNHSDFSINVSMISTNVPGININDANISLNTLNIKPNSPNIHLINQIINFIILNLLRDNAFISGYKAIVFVCTLFLHWKKAFPINRELFRQWNKNLSVGKTAYF